MQPETMASVMLKLMKLEACAAMLLLFAQLPQEPLWAAGGRRIRVEGRGRQLLQRKLCPQRPSPLSLRQRLHTHRWMMAQMEAAAACPWRCWQHCWWR